MNKVVKGLKSNCDGISLIEVLIALALLGAVAGAFLGGVAMAYKADIIAGERTNAESLTRSELEYVKSQPFSLPCPDSPWSYQASSTIGQSSNQPSWWDSANPHTLPDEYQGYSVVVSAEGCDANADGTNDEGIWKITVEVYHSETSSPGDLVLITTTYKVNR
jgi:prepilin-type N-terminal cleavage/methylation domain-containing protein